MNWESAISTNVPSSAIIVSPANCPADVIYCENPKGKGNGSITESDGDSISDSLFKVHVSPNNDRDCQLYSLAVSVPTVSFYCSFIVL